MNVYLFDSLELANDLLDHITQEHPFRDADGNVLDGYQYVEIETHGEQVFIRCGVSLVDRYALDLGIEPTEIDIELGDEADV